jgi:hypothetical protein
MMCREQSLMAPVVQPAAANHLASVHLQPHAIAAPAAAAACVVGLLQAYAHTQYTQRMADSSGTGCAELIEGKQTQRRNNSRP